MTTVFLVGAWGIAMLTIGLFIGMSKSGKLN